MQFSNLFVTLLLSTTVAAMPKGDKNKEAKATNGTESVKSQCHQIEKYTAMVSLAANTTALDAKTHGNATKAAALTAKAAEAQTKLTALESNSTLVSICDVQFAAEKVEDQCDEIDSLNKMIATAANTTALDAKTHGNATKAAAFTAKAAAAQTKLTELTSNTTLTDACTTITTAKEAKKEAQTEAKAASASSTASSTAAAASSTSKSTSGSAANVANTGIFSAVVLVAAMVVLL